MTGRKPSPSKSNPKGKSALSQKPRTKRERLVSAIIKAEKEIQEATDLTDVARLTPAKRGGKSGGSFGHGGVAEPERQVALEIVAPVVAVAETKGAIVAAYVNRLADKLERIGCGPTEVTAYLRAERQCLAVVYLEARQAHPSPTTLRGLALRYALDARKPITGSLARYQVRHLKDRWEITECSSVAAANSGLPALPGIPITDLKSMWLLHLTYTVENAGPRLIEWIESVYGRVPLESDVRRQGKPEIQYEVVEDRKDGNKVRLWVGGREVALPDWDGVHNLLELLFEFRSEPLVGAHLKSARITNPSKACKVIRKALDATSLGAGDWLETRPIKWRVDIELRERRSK